MVLPTALAAAESSRHQEGFQVSVLPANPILPCGLAGRVSLARHLAGSRYQFPMAAHQPDAGTHHVMVSTLWRWGFPQTGDQMMPNEARL